MTLIFNGSGLNWWWIKKRKKKELSLNFGKHFLEVKNLTSLAEVELSACDELSFEFPFNLVSPSDAYRI